MNSKDLKQKWPDPNKKFPIIFIGAGGIIKNCHIPAYQKIGFDLQGIYDLNKDSSDQLSHEFNIPNVYETLNEALSQKEVVFDIAVPPDQLLDIVRLLPNNSCALLQKPMGSNYSEAKKILEICNDKKIIAALNFQLRFSPMMLCLRDIIEKDMIGEIVDIEFHYSYFLPWHLWPFLEELDRVEIPLNSIHYFDLIRSIFGMPKGVFAYSTGHPKYPKLKDAKTTAILIYPGNLRCALSLNHCYQFGPDNQSANVKIEGTKGVAFLTLGSMLNYPNYLKDKLEIKINNNEWEEIPLEGSWMPDAFGGTMSNLQRYISGEDKKLETDVNDTVHTMKLVDALLKSQDNFYEVS